MLKLKKSKQIYVKCGLIHWLNGLHAVLAREHIIINNAIGFCTRLVELPITDSALQPIVSGILVTVVMVSTDWFALVADKTSVHGC